MSQTKRLLIGIVILGGLAGLVLSVEMWRGAALAQSAGAEATLTPGAVPIYLQGQRVAAFEPADLERLPLANFVEPVENKTQEGWLLYDVLRLYLPEEALLADPQVRVISTSRGKSAELTWGEIADLKNMVMFDLSGRGTLKLVSLLDRLATRDQWVQDTDRIEVNVP